MNKTITFEISITVSRETSSREIHAKIQKAALKIAEKAGADYRYQDVSAIVTKTGERDRGW